MSEKNKIQLTGTIERLQEVQTKTGGLMCRWLLKVDQDRFGCVAFANIAEAVLGLSDGEEISVTGSGRINSWKTEAGTWRNDFQVTAWKVEIAGEELQYEKQQPAAPKLQPTTPKQQSIIPPQDDQFEYKGGPF